MALNCMRALQRVAQSRLAASAAVSSSRSYATGAMPEAVETAWRNPAAVLHGVNDLRFEDVPLPERLTDGYVRIEMKAVGICGSDVHYWKKVSSRFVVRHILVFHTNPNRKDRSPRVDTHLAATSTTHQVLGAGPNSRLRCERTDGDWARKCRVRTLSLSCGIIVSTFHRSHEILPKDATRF